LIRRKFRKRWDFPRSFFLAQIKSFNCDTKLLPSFTCFKYKNTLSKISKTTLKTSMTKEVRKGKACKQTKTKTRKQQTLNIFDREN